MPRRTAGDGPQRLPTGSWPFGVLGGLGLLLALQPGEPLDTGLLTLAAALSVIAVLVELARVRAGWQAGRPVAPLVYLAAVAVLREATGGATGGMGALAILPVVWIALHGTRAELYVVIAGVVALFAAPVAVIGAPTYPPGGWRSAVLLTGVVAVLGTTVQGLLGQVRRQAELARHREAERLTLLQRLEGQAATDPLTGIANRRAWDAGLAGALGAAALDGRPISLAILDLDGFKARNDSAGHEAGDAALCDAAEAWSRELRPTDLLGRLGGDEFGVMLSGCAMADALPLVERLRAVTPGGLTCSAGLVERQEGEGARELQARADTMLYDAKATGRDRTVTQIRADESAPPALS